MPLNLICHLEESPLVSVFSEVGTLRDNIYVLNTFLSVIIPIEKCLSHQNKRDVSIDEF